MARSDNHIVATDETKALCNKKMPKPTAHDPKAKTCTKCAVLMCEEYNRLLDDYRNTVGLLDQIHRLSR
jgi:transcription termination factor Rho